jgi:hypothetical protein
MKVTDFVYTGNTVHFSSYKQNYFWYVVRDKITGDLFRFPILMDEIGGTELLHTDKAILFMRWIRKAIDDGTMVLEDTI